MYIGRPQISASAYRDGAAAERRGRNEDHEPRLTECAFHANR
jgi:hypothetical protein